VVLSLRICVDDTLRLPPYACRAKLIPPILAIVLAHNISFTCAFFLHRVLFAWSVRCRNLSSEWPRLDCSTVLPTRSIASVAFIEHTGFLDTGGQAWPCTHGAGRWNMPPREVLLTREHTEIADLAKCSIVLTWSRTLERLLAGLTLRLPNLDAGLENLQHQYVRYQGQVEAKPADEGWTIMESEAQWNSLHTSDSTVEPFNPKQSMPQQVQLNITSAPAEFCLPMKNDRQFKPHFQVQVCSLLSTLSNSFYSLTALTASTASDGLF
jgi:hypothetical protein